MVTEQHTRYRRISKIVSALVPVAGVLLLDWEAPVVLTWYWAAFVPALLVDPYLSRIVWPDPPLVTATPPPMTPKTPFLSVGDTKVRIDAAGMTVPGTPTMMRQGMLLITSVAAIAMLATLWGVGVLDVKALPIAALVQTIRRITVEKESRMRWMRRTPCPPDAMMLTAVLILTVPFFGAHPALLLTAVVVLGLGYELLVERAESKSANQ